HDLFSRRRDRRLQFQNLLRPGQRHDAHRVDESACLTRRPADGQYPHAKSARSDLQSIATGAIAVAEQLTKAAWSCGFPGTRSYDFVCILPETPKHLTGDEATATTDCSPAR